MKQLVIILVFTPFLFFGQEVAQIHSLQNEKHVEYHNVKGSISKWDGKEALKLEELSFDSSDNMLAVLKNVSFRNAVIEFYVTAIPSKGARPDARGFAGFAFRINPMNYGDYEAIYLRFTNGRSPVQELRNHTTQYISKPDYDWKKLRELYPARFESYVDIIPGEWAKIRIEVSNNKARLYVNDATQPALIINELLKENIREGLGALWIGPMTEAYFANVKIYNIQ